jgi:hypothetical protein
MFGLIGTVAVVCQMAALSLGFPVMWALSVGLLGCGAWIIHAVKQKDAYLAITNAVVAGFALYGLT